MLACVMTTMASADNYFYIDDLRISTNDVGQRITVPVKASFESYVSSWSVQFSFPEGLVPISVRNGSGMNVAYCNDDGEEDTFLATMAHHVNQDDNTLICIGSNYGVDYQLNEFGDYEYCGSIKWAPGQFDEMLLLTFKVNEYFQGGDIVINTQTTCGYDSRNESNTVYPSTMEYGDGYYPGDVNCDGVVTIADLTALVDYMMNPDANSQYISFSSGEVVYDGEINIMDLNKLLDYLLTAEWYDGYIMLEKSSTATVTLPLPIAYNNYFYIDDLRISTNDVGQRITVPVKASFESYVSSWSVQFSLPQGLVPLYLRNGSDMNVAYCNADGEEDTYPGTMAHHVNQDDNVLTCFGMNYGANYQLNEYGEYEYGGSVKWAPGQFDEMLLLTFRVDETFEGGDIVINSQTTCGYEPRDEFNTVYPSTMEHGEEVLPGDVNADGSITINDLVHLMDYMNDPVANSEYIHLDACELVDDGAINIMDLNKLLDLLITGTWYDGYFMTQAENIISIPGLISSGDVNGDGRVSLSDVVMLVDYLLYYEQGFYDANADVNGDGHITIGDVSAIIDIMMNQ